MSSDSHSQERRTVQRFQVGWDLFIKGKDQSDKPFDQAGALQNLSSRGAYFYLSKLVKLGANLDVEIRVPLAAKTCMKYSSEVVRVERMDSGFAVAVRFATARPTFLEH